MARPHLSVVIPAYNEEAAIGQTLRELSAHLRQGTGTYEIIVASDGSTDGTEAMVAAFQREHDPHVQLLTLRPNRGKGAALREGIAQATGEIVAFTDADLPYRLENLDAVVGAVARGEAEIAVGARDLAQSEGDPSYPMARKIAGRLFSVIVTAVLRVPVFDTQCGLKAFRGDIARQIFARVTVEGFGFDFETMYLAARSDYRIARVPVGMSHRHESKVRLVRDSILMLRDLFAVRWRHGREAAQQSGECPACLSHGVGKAQRVKGVRVLHCGQCGTRRVDPIPSEAELRELYDGAYYTSHASSEIGYGSAENEEGIRRTALRRLEEMRTFVQPRARVLEVGAGRGLLGAILSAEYVYSGIELAGDAVTAARAAGVDVERADLDSYAPRAKFDAVVLVHVFEHLPDPRRAIAGIAALLEPEGVLMLVTPDAASMLAGISGKRWVSYKFPEHVILYSARGLRTLLERHGFEVLASVADREYCDHAFLKSRVAELSPLLGTLARPLIALLPAIIPVTSGSVRIAAKKR